MSCNNTLEYFFGDTLPEIVSTYYYYDDDNVKKPVDITGFSFQLKINFATPKVVAGVIVDALEGIFKFPFTTSTLDEIGPSFKTEILIIDDTGGEITYEFVPFDIKARIV